MKSVSFEVFGKVQGVFFRKHTQAQAKKLGVSGWVQNTPSGTVVGCVEGSEDKVIMMKRWLQQTGSPKSRIDKCIFKEEKDISVRTTAAFIIKNDIVCLNSVPFNDLLLYSVLYILMSKLNCDKKKMSTF